MAWVLWIVLLAPRFADGDESPRVMVLVQENLKEVPVSRTVENEMIQSLRQAGFPVVDPDQAQKLLEQVRAEVLMSAHIPKEALQKIGDDLNCDILIVGTAVADHYASSGPVTAYMATLNLRVVSTSTAEILCTSSERAKGRGYEPGPAIRSALQKVAQAATKKLLAANALEVQPRIMLFVKLLTDPQVHQLAREVAGKTGTRVQVVYTSPELSLLEVSPGKNGSPDQVKQAVKAFQSPPLRIVQASGAKIVAVAGGRKRQAADARAEEPSSPRVDAFNLVPSERGFTAGSVMLESLRLPNVYPARLLNYADAFAKVSLKNLDADSPLHDVRVRVYIPEFMSVPAETEIEILKPGERKEVVLQAIFDRNELFDNLQTQKATAEMTIESEGSAPKVKNYDIEVYNRNAINWKDVKSIMNFVTPTDSVVKDFTSSVLSRVDLEGVQPCMVSILKANAIFVALASMPLRYIADPNRDFENQTLDYVQFPRETLRRKSGDCDDLSVLFASCLESVGIATQFLVTRDHIFLEFDAGASSKSWMDITCNKARFDLLKDSLWIPMELTRFCPESRCFTEAWLDASSRYQRVKARSDTQRIDFEKDSQHYPPFPLPETDERVSPPAKDLPIRIAESMSFLFQEKDLALKKEQEAYRLRLAKNPGDLEAHNGLGVLLCKGGEVQKAREVFSSVLEQDPGNEKARHNLGNAYLLMNQPGKAIEQYRLAPRNDSDPETLYNMGVAYYLMKEEREAESSLRQAYDHLPSTYSKEQKVAWMLGVSDLKEEKNSLSYPWLEGFKVIIYRAVGGDERPSSSSWRGRQSLEAGPDLMRASDVLWWKM